MPLPRWPEPPTPLTGPLFGLIAYHALGVLVGAEQCLRLLLATTSDRRFVAPDLVSTHATATEAAVLALGYGVTAVLLWRRFRVALAVAALLAVAGAGWWLAVHHHPVSLQLVAIALLVLPGARRPLVRRLRPRPGYDQMSYGGQSQYGSPRT